MPELKHNRSLKLDLTKDIYTKYPIKVANEMEEVTLHAGEYLDWQFWGLSERAVQQLWNANKITHENWCNVHQIPVDKKKDFLQKIETCFHKKETSQE